MKIIRKILKEKDYHPFENHKPARVKNNPMTNKVSLEDHTRELSKIEPKISNPPKITAAALPDIIALLINT